MQMLGWVAVLVSIIAWFLGDWIFGRVFPDDGFTAFVATCIFALVAGAFAMLFLRMRAMQSGRYKKASWGVRRR